MNIPRITSYIAEQRPSSQQSFDLSIRDLGSFPLSPVCNPYYELFSANNTSSSHELDVGTFRPNQYKPCVFLAHHPGQTHNNTNLLVGVYSKHPQGLCKDAFNHVRNHKDAHALWSDVCALHEGTKSEREEHYHLVMKKLNSFEMLPKECANEIYSRLNVLIEKVNGLGLISDVIRKILSVLPIDKYGHIVTVLHEGDLSTATPTQILEKINAHEMYMHITPQDGSSSKKKKEKDLAFKASQEKGKARLE